MKILLVGNGGREHAIAAASKQLQEQKHKQIYFDLKILCLLDRQD